MLSTSTIPQPEAPPQADKPKVPRCKGCGGRWLPGHACVTPSRTPATPTHWHRHDQGTRLFETHPSPAGQMVYRKTWRCGHETVECCQGRPAMLEDRAQGREALCYPCAFRANRTATDEEQVRG